LINSVQYLNLKELNPPMLPRGDRLT